MAHQTASGQFGLSVAAFLAVAIIAPSGLPAQASLSPPACAYDQCALRVEENRILRGVSGERVGKLGLFSATNLSALVSGVPSDSALAHARIFDANYGRGSTLFFAGVMTAAVALGVEQSRREQRLTGGTSTGFAIAFSGIVVEIVGTRKILKARKALSRAIWWYNRELAR